MNCTFNTNTRGRLTAKVLKMNARTALVEIMTPAPTMICPHAWRLTGETATVHLIKNRVKLYPDYIIPGRGY